MTPNTLLLIFFQAAQAESTKQVNVQAPAAANVPLEVAEKAPASAKIERKPQLPRQETMNRLRLRKQPITLFGESDLEREDRLRALEVSDPKAERTSGPPIVGAD